MARDTVGGMEKDIEAARAIVGGAVMDCFDEPEVEWTGDGLIIRDKGSSKAELAICEYEAGDLRVDLPRLELVGVDLTVSGVDSYTVTGEAYRKGEE